MLIAVPSSFSLGKKYRQSCFLLRGEAPARSVGGEGADSGLSRHCQRNKECHSGMFLFIGILLRMEIPTVSNCWRITYSHTTRNKLSWGAQSQCVGVLNNCAWECSISVRGRRYTHPNSPVELFSWCFVVWRQTQDHCTRTESWFQRLRSLAAS